MSTIPNTSIGLQTFVGVCHHCGRLLREDEAVSGVNDQYFSDGATALHCNACYRRYHTVPKAFPWGRVLVWLFILALLALAIWIWAVGRYSLF